MLGFLENNLRKKILLAEIFYISRGNYSDKEVCEELGLSLSTLRLYEIEVRKKFESKKKNGMLFNSNALVAISKEYIDESTKVKLLELFICSPGECSSFYKNKLNFSDATFSRMLRQIRVELKKYHVKLVVKHGYYLESDNHLHVILLMTHIGKYFHFPLENIYKRIQFLQSELSIDKIDGLEELDFTFCHSEFEEAFFKYFNAFIILRHLENNHYYSDSEVSSSALNGINKIKSELTELYSESEKKVNERFDLVTRELGEKGKDYSSLKKLLVAAMFQIDLFPYNIKTISLRISFFVKKFQKNRPEEYVSTESVIYRLNRLMRTDFFKRKDIILFFILSESFFIKKNREEKTFYIFSSLNRKHAQILYNQIKPLASFFEGAISFKVVDDLETIEINRDHMLISTEFCDKFSKSSQFLISDYISLQEIVQLGLWIKESVTF